MGNRAIGDGLDTRVLPDRHALQNPFELLVDAIEVSTGIGDVIPAVCKGDEVTPYRDFAAAVGRAVDVPVIAVAGVRRLATAEDIVSSGDADMVALSRPLIREPGLVARWGNGETSPATCISCNRCGTDASRGDSLECGEDRRLRERTNR